MPSGNVMVKQANTTDHANGKCTGDVSKANTLRPRHQAQTWKQHVPEVNYVGMQVDSGISICTDRGLFPMTAAYHDLSY